MYPKIYADVHEQTKLDDRRYAVNAFLPSSLTAGSRSNMLHHYDFLQKLTNSYPNEQRAR